MHPTGVILLQVLRSPQRMRDLSLAQWDALIPLTRNAKLLARLCYLARAHHVFDVLDARVRQILDNARVEAAEQERLLRWEVGRVHRALDGAGTPIVLLKGVAYLIADLPPSRGRFSGDVDFLVPKEHLAEVEQTLTTRGWEPVELDEYDQRYYRQWMHELPPMCHRERSAVIDLHHALAPECGRLHPDPRKIFEQSQPIAGLRFRVPSPADLVLHSSLHLFGEGEFGSALRDLVDIDALLRHYGADASFSDKLHTRAVELGLTRPLFYALYFTHKLLETPMPFAGKLPGELPGAPAAPVVRLMDVLVTRAAVPEPPDDTALLTRLSELLLFIRGHWLRMPPILLARHLTHKSLTRLFPPRDKKKKPANDVQ